MNKKEMRTLDSAWHALFHLDYAHTTKWVNGKEKTKAIKRATRNARAVMKRIDLFMLEHR